MRVGYGCADITPQRSMPLSGFASRRDAPFEGVDDRLSVHALAIQGDDRTTLLLVYDLLALGHELHDELLIALKGLPQVAASKLDCILCTTHTHSAPATITLLGCGTPQADYWLQILSQSVAAASDALRSMRPARLRHVTKHISGESYNRRQVLDDGRVVMSMKPDGPVRHAGPIWEPMHLLRLDAGDGSPIAGIVHWAAHPDTVCGTNVTADCPGELCRRLSGQCGFPFIYLQGACANINPILDEMTRAQMLRNTDAIMRKLGAVEWPRPEAVGSPALARKAILLQYAGPKSAVELREMRHGMRTIELTGDGPPDQMKIVANILNVRPGDPVPADMAKHFARILHQWAEQMLARREAGPSASCELSLSALRLGPVVFCFVAAEVFVESAIEIAEAFPDQSVDLVSYASPLVGYLPTDDALDEGGYEADHAYVFYNHPAPFAKGSEPAAVRALTELVRDVSQERT